MPHLERASNASCASNASNASFGASFQFHDVGSSSETGNRYGTLNQDYVAVQEVYTPEEVPDSGKQVYIQAICDGHGILGEKAASFAGKAIIRSIYSGSLRNKNLSKVPSSDLEAEMKLAFSKGHTAACSVYDNPPRTVELHKGAISHTMTLTEVNGIGIYRCNGKGPEKLLEFGCTATVAVLQGRRVCLANVGDSQAVLGACNEQGDCSAEMLTERHWGRDEAEAARIREAHAQEVKLLEDGYLRVNEGPWMGYELSVTRALGHKNIQKYGVTPEPYVVTRDLEPQHFCLVLASDGIWDVMTASEVVGHVMDSMAEHRTAAQAAAALVQHAIDLGLGGPGGEQDNTSAIVTYL